MQKFTPAFFLFSFTLAASPAFAGSFDISNASTSKQSLSSGQTGVVEKTGTLTVSGSSDAIDLTGSATITNSGTISQTGSGRDIRDNTGGLTLTVTNNAGALMQTADADVIQMNKANSNVTLNNYGTMNSLNASIGGAQAVDFNAITSGSNTINNYSTGIMEAYEADAVRPGVNGVVNNDGTIVSTRASGSTSGTDGVDAQTNTGIVIVNDHANNGTGSALIEGARHGITGGNTDPTVDGGAFTMSITNNANGTIQGDDGSGINIDGVNGNELVTIVNHGTITGHGVSGDGDGVDVDGLVNLTNTGTIKSIDANNDTSEGVTVGGGTIVNSGTIEGDVASGNKTSATGVGITLAGIDKDANDNPIPVQGIYGNTTVTNSGHIRGLTASAIQATGAANAFTIQINNQAGGVIEGGGATAAAIQTGGNNDTVINSGTIEADSSGKAVDLGAGTNSFQIEGGAAVVTGDISGGTGSTNSSMTVDAGTGNSFAYSGGISNFSTIEIKSGTFNLNGSIAGGTTTIDSGSTFSGNATVGALNIKGTLSPGNSPGVVHAGNTILSAGGNFLFQVSTDGSTGSAGTNWDQLAVTGSLDVSGLGSSKTFTFELQSLDGSNAANPLGAFDANTNHVWTDVITTTAGFAGTFNSSDFTVDTSLFQNSTNGTFSIVRDANNANDLDLEYTAAPEPTTWVMLLGGLGLLAFTQRRKSSV